MIFQDRDLVPDKKKGTGFKKILLGIFLGIIAGQGLVLVVQTFWIFPWRVAPVEMEPVFKGGEKLYINRLFNPKSLKRGDLIVLHLPENPDYMLLRRVVGLPGDTVEIQSRRILINGKPYSQEPENLVQKHLESTPPFPRGISINDDMSPKQILEKEIFVLGDNRITAVDSRQIGPFPYSSFEGKAY